MRHSTQTPVKCPPLLLDYQQFMRGVDRGDQMICLYNIGRRSKKWWKQLFSYIIECSILNVLQSDAKPGEYARRGRSKHDYLKFRLELAIALIDGFCSRKRPGRRQSDENLQLEIKSNIGSFSCSC